MSIIVILQPNTIGFRSEKDREKLRKISKDRPGTRAEIVPLLPESRKMRGFYHGGVLSIWAYLNDLDYMDSDVIHALHEEAKKEFNGETIILDGEPKKIGKSTKGILVNHIEKVIEYLEENYGIDRSECLNPEDYKYWRDALRSNGGPDNYIDYLLEKGVKIKKS